MTNPNSQLRYYRELRGWSQQKVADAIQADMKMVSKWERGIAIPSPYYREKLCTLFEKNALELGLIKKQPGDNTIHENNKEATPQSHTSQTKLEDPLYFSFGCIETSWVVVDGDGTEEYKPENIKTYFNPEPDKLPDELAARREQIQRQQEINRARGLPFHWNGERYSLDKIVISRSAVEEDMTLDLWFRPSDYYTFLATNQSLKDDTLREKYLKNADWQSPVRFFSNSFGISLAIVTPDNYTLFTQRGKNLGSRPSEFNVSASEGLSKALDHKPDSQTPDLYHCASRGMVEELGLNEPGDFRRSDIVFLSLGVDTHYSLWGIRGSVKINTSIEDVINIWKKGVKDKIENMRIHAVKFEPEAIAQFVFSHSPWTPGGLACIYHALVYEYGRRRVDEAIKRCLLDAAPSIAKEELAEDSNHH